MYPIKAEINMDKEEIVICTPVDLRFYNLSTGRLKKIFTHLLNSEESDSLVNFQLIQKNHKFLLADHRGKLAIYSYASGELLNYLTSH